jgi:spore coat-associated protein N
MTDEDNSKTIELNRRRVLGGIVTIGGAAAAAGAGTTALFSDTQNNTSNTISAGELSLSSISGSPMSISGLYPSSDSTDSKQASIDTEYTGGVDAILDWGIEIVNDPQDMASKIELENATLEAGGDGTDYSDDHTTLQALVDNSPVSNYRTITDGTTITLTLDVRLSETAGNKYEGETIDIAVGFKARQPSDNGESVGSLSEGEIKGTA